MLPTCTQAKVSTGKCLSECPLYLRDELRVPRASADDLTISRVEVSGAFHPDLVLGQKPEDDLCRPASLMVFYDCHIFHGSVL